MNIYFYVFILLHRFLRGVAYREFTQLVHGFLGGKQIPLPAIKTELSEENEELLLRITLILGRNFSVNL